MEFKDYIKIVNSTNDVNNLAFHLYEYNKENKKIKKFDFDAHKFLRKTLDKVKKFKKAKNEESAVAEYNTLLHDLKYVEITKNNIKEALEFYRVHCLLTEVEVTENKENN